MERTAYWIDDKCVASENSHPAIHVVEIIEKHNPVYNCSAFAIIRVLSEFGLYCYAKHSDLFETEEAAVEELKIRGW